MRNSRRTSQEEDSSVFRHESLVIRRNRNERPEERFHPWMFCLFILIVGFLLILQLPPDDSPSGETSPTKIEATP